MLAKGEGGHSVILFNNLNSFTCSRERACEFGDYIVTVDVPLSKIFSIAVCYPAFCRARTSFW